VVEGGAGWLGEAGLAGAGLLDAGVAGAGVDGVDLPSATVLTGIWLTPVLREQLGQARQP
jgi:hypothetical protein